MKKIYIYNSFDELKSDLNNSVFNSEKTDEKQLLELIDILRDSFKSKKKEWRNKKSE